MLEEIIITKKKKEILPENIEYSVVIDGIIELRKKLDKESFFDGLFDAMIEYAEKHNAIAGLSMEHGEYIEELDGEERT